MKPSKSKTLEGKVAVVAGASRGAGGLFQGDAENRQDSFRRGFGS